MKPTSVIIAKQIAALDAALASLQDHAEALAFDAVTGNRAVATELAKVNTEIEGAKQDRAVLVNARRRALALEAEAGESAADADRAAHRAEASQAAAAALRAANALDHAITAFIAASADLEGSEATLRQHVRLAGDNPDGRTGRKDASAHGHFLLARIADGSARRRTDRTVAELIAAAWREYLDPALKETENETN